MLRTTLIICAIASQVLSAPKPNGCTELCNTYRSQQTHESLVQQQTAALNELQRVTASQLKDFELSRPGNWTDRNEYRTDGGRGRVYEEHGQIVNGPRRIQYYKKNYSSSHGVNADAGLSGGVGEVHSNLDSQRLIGSTSGLGSHHSTYDEQRLREVHRSTNRVAGHSERLEDFGENVDDTQQVVQPISGVSGGGNWHRADSWRTDGGHGVVHEEEGQLVKGATKVKYYRQNYSSSYSSGDAGAVVPAIAQPNLEAELERLHSTLDSYGREIHRSTVGQTNRDSASQTVDHSGYVDGNVLTTTNVRPQPLSTYETVQEQQRSTVRHGIAVAPVSKGYHRTKTDRYQESESSGSDYSATNSHVDDRRERQQSQRLYVVPSAPLATVDKSEAHEVYRETVAPQSQIVVSSDNERSVDRASSQLLRVPIHANSNYRSFYTDSEVRPNHLTTGVTLGGSTTDSRHSGTSRSSRIFNQNLQHQNSYSDGNVEMIDSIAQQPAAVNHYEEKWSEGYRRHSTVPQRIGSSQIVVGQHANYLKTGQTAEQLGSYRAANSHNSRSSHHESGSQFYEGFRTPLEQTVTGALTLGNIGQTGADCDQAVTTSEQYQYGAVHQRKFKREADPGYYNHKNDGLSEQSQQVEDLTQQTAGFDDFYQRRPANLEHGQQHQQEHLGKLELGQASQQTEDLTQQSSDFRDQSQQASGRLGFGHRQHEQHLGKLELNQETQQTEDMSQQTSGFENYGQLGTEKLEFGHQQQMPHSGKLELEQESQQTDHLTQQTGGFDDFTQQTSGNLEFGQQRRHDKLKYGQESQQTEDLTQQTGGFDDFTQQTSGNLEFGQQRRHDKPKYGQESQQTEDLTQQTGGFDDFTQQTSGNLEFGQQRRHDKPKYGQESQQTEDLTQQTGGFDDFTQQISGNLEFGQQRRHDKPKYGQESQQTEDLTQQTGGFDDFTQQTSGNLEFGQQRRHDKPEYGQVSQQTEDLTQQTGGFDDFTQQTSGNLELGQQRRHEKPKYGQESQLTEDLTQQTGGFDDFTQQTSGNLELGQQRRHDKPKYGQESQLTEDLTQQTGGFDDFTQQTSGNLEFGQQRRHDKPKYGQESQQTEDLTQQTGGFDDFTQQSSGNLEFGQQRRHDKPKHEQEPQQTEDLTQQTGGFDDFTQQTSGNLELGQQRRHDKPKYGQESQLTEDLTQQSGGFDDFTQQTSGNLEFGQQRRHDKPKYGQESQQTEDLTQQTGGFDDFTQQSSGNLEFGQQRRHDKPKHEQEPQQTEDLTQQTGGFDDFTQQPSGNLEFGQQRRHDKPKHEQEPQQTEDLTQQTGGFDDFTQQTSGNLEFGQQRRHDKPKYGQESQQTGRFDDFAHQTSGNLELEQQRRHEKPKYEHESQQTDDLTQQTGGFDDFTQQTSGNLEFGQQRRHDKPTYGQQPQQTDDLTQQTGGFDDFTQQTSGNLEFGQQRQHDRTEFGQQTQHSDLSQQTGAFGDFTQQSSGNLELGQDQQEPGIFDDREQTTTVKPRPAYQPGVKGGRRRKPAPKPTLRSGRRHSLDSDGGDNDFSTNRNVPLDAQPEPDPDHGPISQKPGDVPTVLDIDEPDTRRSQNQETNLSDNPNARWHLNHRPGDLTNSESPENHRVVNHQIVHEQHSTQSVRKYQSNSDRPLRQPEVSDSRRSGPSHPTGSGNSEPEFKVEPRIVEAYGGAGAYDADHNDDIFSGAKHNPSATLPPNPAGLDPWDIREKPAEIDDRPWYYTRPTEETTTVLPEEPPATRAPSFWNKISNKLTSTYEKAKEKATGIFGK